MMTLLQVLAQIDDSKISGLGEPPLQSEYAYSLTWVITALLVTLILLVTFKTSKRNAMDKE